MDIMKIEEPVWDGDILRCGNATLEKRKGINIVHLKGSYYEMGAQHARLAEKASGDVVFDYFDGLIKMVIKHSLEPAAGIGDTFLKWLFYTLNKNRFSPEIAEHIAGFAEAQGKSPVQVAKTFLIPDILHFLIGKAFPQFAPSPACSGFMARGSATSGGRLLVGRNYDFFAQGIWDANNGLIFMEPNDGHKYCWIGALGGPISGQGMNESGMIISLHTKFTKDVRMTGIPLFSMIAKILAEATSVDEAIAIIGAQPRMCGLTCFAVDSKTQDAAAIGFSANNMEIARPGNDFLPRANHYVSDQMKKIEYDVFQWKMHSESRYLRLKEMIEEKHGSLEPVDIPIMLADNTDYWEKKKRIAGNILCATNTAQAVAYSPDDDSIWIGNGPFPVCASDVYQGFKISALFKRDRDNYEIDDLPGGDSLNETQKQARTLYQEAWSDHLDNFRDDLAVMKIRQAADLAPEEPVFPRMAGFLLLKSHKYQQALQFFEKNAQFEYRSEQTKAESLLWLGRCLDLLGRREEAIANYKKAASLEAFPLSNAAKKNINTPFSPKQIAAISPEPVVGTTLAKY